MLVADSADVETGIGERDIGEEEGSALLAEDQVCDSGVAVPPHHESRRVCRGRTRQDDGVPC